MSTCKAKRIVQDVVFGPYESRRFGRSLGINPLGGGSKFCNFACVYCECGNPSWPVQWDLRPQFPDGEAVREAITVFADSHAGIDPDSITITGEGEPTLSPYLNEIVDVISQARDRNWPQARTVILTNGTTCHLANIRAAVAKLDERVVKLDAGTNWILDQLNRPIGTLRLAELLRRISMMPDVTIQSMFVHGPVDNTEWKQVENWTQCLIRLAPAGVQIYSLSRLPAVKWARQVSRAELQAIAEYVEATARIPVQVY